MKSALIGFLLVVVISLGCNRKTTQESPASSPDGLSRAQKAPPPPPVTLVHGQFKIATYKTFEFEVPPHTIAPRLDGNFETASEGSNIDFMVMTQEEFEEFSHGRGGTSRYSVTNSPAQTIEYALPSTLESAQKYYVVFRNPGGRQAPMLVNANLTASF